MSSGFDAETVATVATQSGFQIVEQVALPQRSPSYRRVPESLHTTARELLESLYSQGLYSHQAEAIAAGLRGDDVCLATSTASGKSLVFMSVAADVLLRDERTTVLALYPARALIQDQLEKWGDLFRRLDLSFAFIDGSVPVETRAAILRGSRVVLMTPDVGHAWLLRTVGERDTARFLERLRLVVLDEAHVYDGVFGTNMAYFLRRLQVVAAPFRIISSTATVGKPDEFLTQLTGRRPTTLGPDRDGSATPPKVVLLAEGSGKSGFEATANLLRDLAKTERGRFLAFGDSRNMVEQVVAAARRAEHADDDRQDDDEEIDDAEMDEKGDTATSRFGAGEILPYRAGYEAEDRVAIQKALAGGTLAGVVSTSALELGLDIGDIDLIVLLNVPPTVKALWQRFGRAGRKRPGVCLVLDPRGSLRTRRTRLSQLLQLPPEPSWLYLDNRYLQYANALCAALEQQQRGGRTDLSPFDSLPLGFRKLLDNEINPSEAVPPELYALKQRAEAGPHHEFPIRSGIERSFQVTDGRGLRLGTLTFSQLLREAYPGAVHYYMARPYRVYKYNYRAGEVGVRREKYFRTRPLSQAKVFPRFQGGLLHLLRSERGFVAEAEMQVSERVLGFTEHRGSVKEDHRYGPASPYSQRELTRFFETTGVCFCFPGTLNVSEALASLLLDAFCADFGVQTRDLGIGSFYAKASPLGPGICQGVCIFDATSGSLRLTQRLAERFQDVVEAARLNAAQDEDVPRELTAQLGSLAELAAAMVPVDLGMPEAELSSAESEWVEVVAPGSRAMCVTGTEMQEVEVLGYRYTPQGIMYDLRPSQPGLRWSVAARYIQPLHGETSLLRVNLMTGESGRVD
jgi:DEAD/DEAH box helicase domain-containing protein